MSTTRRQSPTVKARRVAATLKASRERAGLTLSAAAARVDHDNSWLSRIERLEARVHPSDVIALLRVYGLDAPAIDAVAALARQAKQRGWWYQYSDVMPAGFDSFVGIETDATFIRTWEPQNIPGLLQTEGYARAAFMSATSPEASTERVAERVALRLERQAVLAAADPPQLRVVLDEAAIRRQVGGAKVMREQVMHLVEMSDRPNVQVQILLMTAGAHAGMDGGFVVFDVPPPPPHYPGVADDKIVYLDTKRTAIYLEEPDEVADYAATFEQIRADALTPQESRDLMVAVAAEM